VKYVAKLSKLSRLSSFIFITFKKIYLYVFLFVLGLEDTLHLAHRGKSKNY
jgi:hypothetical protein